MYTISKTFEFSASHNLIGLQAGHPCSRVHGHNYTVTIEMKKEQLCKDGFVLDYREMQPIKEYLDRAFDHKHLNDFFEGQPSAERIACNIYQILVPAYPFLSAVTVSETPKTFARYEP